MKRLLIFVCFAAITYLTVAPRAFSQTSSSVSVAIVGSERVSGGNWDQGVVTLQVNGTAATVPYGRFSTPASLASYFGAAFSLPLGASSFCPQGVCAKASGNNVIFTTKASTCIQQIASGGSTASFSVNIPPLPGCGQNAPTLSCTPTSFAGSAAVSCSSSLSQGTSGSITFTIDSQFWISAPLNSQGTAQVTQQISLTEGTHLIVASYNTGSSVLSSPAVSLQVQASSGSNVIYGYSIQAGNGDTGYAPNGNIIAYSDLANGYWSLGYDVLDRLTSSQQNGQTSGFQAGCWSYDDFGNRGSQVFADGPIANGTCSPQAGSRVAADMQVVDTGNHMTSHSTGTNGSYQQHFVAYDANGNLTSDNLSSTDTSQTYLYDAENRLCASHGPDGWTGYIYDAIGNRVAQGSISGPSCDLSINGFSPTRQYILGHDGSEMTMLDGTGNWLHTNVSMGDGVFATYAPDGLHFQLTDWLGTRRVQTNYAGLIEDVCQTLPFGDAMACSTSNNASGRVFTGKERDTESGLDYFGARYYGSNMGRFMSPDWAEKPEPIPYADLTNPQSFNLYSYAGNNPLSRADADGHLWQELGNLLKYGHYVNNDGLEAALQGDADEARKNISGYKNLNVNGKSPADALTGLSNKQTVDLDRSLTNFFENNMMSSPGTQLGLVIASFGAEGLEARVVSGIEAANGTVITGFTEHGVDRAIGDAAAGTPGARAGTRPQAILDAIKNPTKVTSGIDSQGRPYQVFTGKDARVVVNPSSGRIVSVNPLSGAGAH